MIVYTAKKCDFVKDVESEQIHEIIHLQFKRKLLRRASQSEIRSWQNSMQCMLAILDDVDIPDDSGVHIEYNLPSTSKRIDFILTGCDADKNEKAVIIELKQWSEVEKTDKDGIVKTWLGGGLIETNHPSYQAWSYAAHIEDFNQTVRDEDIALEPCAFLHNMNSGSAIRDSFYEPHLQNAPVFISRDAKKLSEFLKKHVKYGDTTEIMYRIENGKIKPSKHLADSLASMMKGKREFVLLDDQKLAYETAIKLSSGIADGEKQTLIIHGGPGTGKSVLAINMLVEFINRGLVTHYVSKNAAPRAVYKAKLTGTLTQTRISNLFKGSGAYYDCLPDSIDILVVDEAHRLNAKSGLYANLGENQIKEIINVAKLSVFFIDEDQRVTLKDIGHADEIRSWASQLGSKIQEIELQSQFRCNGSDGYLSFTDDLLQIRETANVDIEGLGYEIKVFDNPNELKQQILLKNDHNKARMVAGYCWDWKSKKTPSAFDIEFPLFNFKARWNLGSDGSTWAIATNSIEQIGCIHTCQGLEFDYVGVIVGPDLIVREGTVITDGFKRSSNDQSIKGFRSQFATNPVEAKLRVDSIIKNTYRTLMTRGQKGCYIYCTDAETSEYFKQRIAASNKAEVALAALASQNEPDTADILPFKIITKNELSNDIEAVPLLDLDIAAGPFGAFQHVDEDTTQWIELPDGFKYSKDLFVAKVMGESMNKKIPNGAWCLFKANPVGTKQGKVVVAQLNGHLDTDTGGSYTIKLYSSNNTLDSDNELQKSITLSPASTDKSYQPITVSNGDEVLLVAELVAVVAT